MRNCWTATSYAEYHRNGCTHAAYSPGCRPLGSHSRLATTPSTMPRRLHRYKTLPARDPSGPPGTKLSQHARNTPFRRILRQQGELCTASTTTKPSRANFLPHTEPPTVQNSPDTRPRRPNRYKTLPARPKHPFSAHFAPAGRVLYRFHHHQAEQGELCTAYGTTYGTKLSPLAAPAGPPGTKLSRHAAPAGPTGTKLSRHARNTPLRRILRQQGEFYTASTTTKPSRANFVPHTEPPTVQNSPSTPENADFGPLSARRESFIPLPPPPDQAGRKKSRTGRAKRGGASPYSPRNALIAGISRTAWTRPAR